MHTHMFTLNIQTIHGNFIQNTTAQFW